LDDFIGVEEEEKKENLVNLCDTSNEEGDDTESTEENQESILERKVVLRMRKKMGLFLFVK
jgi:hypothetical protein